MTAHDRPAGIPPEYDIVAGNYLSASDDIAGTWYVVDRDGDLIDKRGRGYATRAEAWEALREQVGPRCPACTSTDRGPRDCWRCGWHDAR